jgi:hypothetical protein
MELIKVADGLFVPQDFARHHHYYADAEGTKEYSGVTKVLGVIAKPALIPWAARMACEYIEERYEIAKQREAIGTNSGKDELFLHLPNWLKEAANAHRKKKEDAAEKGTDLHALVEGYVRTAIEHNNGEPYVPTGFDPAPIQGFISWAFKEKIRFIATEQRLYSKELWVAGTCDLIFEKDGKRYIGDIKTYKKIWDRVPLIQCAGYAFMWEEMRYGEYAESGQILTEQLPKIDGYCVICLPKERTFNEAEDVLWSWDTEGDREAFLAAVKLYRYLNQK